MSTALVIQEEHHLEVRESRQLLAGCERVGEAKEILDKAAAIQRYLGKRTTEAMNAAEIRLRAERRLGELIPTQINRGTKSHAVTLTDLGVLPMQSSRWQAVARVPEEKFEAYIGECRSAGREITTAGVLRLLPVAVETTAEADAESCDSETGTCGPPTARDRTVHIAGLVEALYQSMVLFESCKTYDVDALIARGTKKSVKELLKKANQITKWLESLKEASNRRIR